MRDFHVVTEDVIHAMPGPLFVFDGQGRMLWWNAHLERAFGYSRERIASMSPLEFFTVETRPTIREGIERVLTEGEGEAEGEILTADGRVLPYRFAAVRTERNGAAVVAGIGIDVGEQKRAEERLRVSEQWFRAMFERAALGGAMVDRDGRVREANPMLARMLRVDAEAVKGTRCLDAAEPEQAEREAQLLRELGHGQRESYQLEKRCVAGDGRVLWLRVSVSRMSDRPEERTFLAFVEDSTEWKATEQKLKQWEKVFENTSEGILITDRSRAILSVNLAFTTVTGYTEEEVLGKDPGILQSGLQGSAFYEEMWDTIRREGSWSGEIWNRRKDGSIYPQWLTISAVTDDDGEVTHYIGEFADITELRESQRELERLAHHDPLTGLANRTALQSELDRVVAKAEQREGDVAVLLLDLDDLKRVNDSLGHSQGDVLLCTVAERLSKLVRAGDTVARIGGDEFVLVLEGPTDRQRLTDVVNRIGREVQRPVNLAGHEVRCRVSIGIARCPGDSEDPQVLLAHADAAMYGAKKVGGNGHRFYDSEMNPEPFARLDLETRLHRAMDREELTVHYQPQVSLVTGQRVAIEALVRWDDPTTEGLLPPARFVPVAEDCGLMVQIDGWVLRRACEQARAWLDRGRGVGRVCVNISGIEIENGDLVDRVQRVLWETRLPPECLEVELKETYAMRSPERAVNGLAGLHAIGVRTAIDDFGTGHSSLAYLKYLPFDTLKIDRSFVRDLPADEENAAIVRSMIGLGWTLGLDVVAEGVETEEQVAFLTAEGCGSGQGFYYGRPEPADRVAE